MSFVFSATDTKAVFKPLVSSPESTAEHPVESIVNEFIVKRLLHKLLYVKAWKRFK